jgi:formamidopyrimidine-DNA glycosylase
MPELPEVETVVRGLRPWLAGRVLGEVVQRRPDLRWPLPEDFAARLTGRRIGRIERRAKYMLIHLAAAEPGGGQGSAPEEVLLIHLGMSGRMVVAADPEAPFETHDHVILVTDEGTQVRFNDPRRFGFMDLIPAAEMDRHRAFKALGPEPLGNAFNGPALAGALAGRRTSIKAALLDQATVAGLGNIYVCEALFEAGLSPRRQAYTVTGKRAEALAGAVRAVLQRAIAAGGSSLRDYRQSDGELGYFQHDWAVYGREGAACARCTCDVSQTGGVKRLVQSNRSTFYCPRRQR